MAFWTGLFKAKPQAPMAARPHPAVPRDPIAEALHATLTDRLDLANARGAWADAQSTEPDPIRAVHALLARLSDLGMSAAIVAVSEAATRAYPAETWLTSASADEAPVGDDPPPSPEPETDLPVAEVAAPADASRAELEALIAAQRFDAAEALFDTLPDSLATEEWYPMAGLRLAQRANDRARLLRHSAQLRDVAPHLPKGYGVASFVLRLQGRAAEAEAIAAAGLLACPKAPGLLREAAEVASANGNDALALQRWEALRALTPKSPEPLLGAARLSIRRGQPGEARRYLLEALAVAPEDRAVLVLAARTATNMLFWDEASTHWQTLMRLFPDSAEIALEAATSFIGPRRGRDRRLPRVLAQFEAMHERFPDFVPAYAEHLRALREANRLDDAEALAGIWLERFPGNLALATAAARVAEDRGQPDLAVARLEAVRTISIERGTPVTPRLEANYIRALSLAGQMALAEEICAAALERFPGDYTVIEQYLALATRTGDFTESSKRAAQVIEWFPDHLALRRLAERIRTLDETKVAEPPATTGPAAKPENLAAFFLRFESLGATSAGCEFGLVQRQFGAEPLGLLRWGNMPIDGLTHALNKRFVGMGDPDTTRVVIQRGSANHREYFIFDDLYSYWAHTFIRVDEAPHDRVLKQSLRRLTFLRDKLLEDLAQAEKIFVFKMTHDVGEAAFDALFDALRAYGDCVLLGVALADAEHPPGTLEMKRPGLFLGRTGMFMGLGGASGAGIDTPLWRSLCEQVAAWRDRQHAPAQAAAE
jgi:tetratricopeptide (TPR) repeat protein